MGCLSCYHQPGGECYYAAARKDLADAKNVNMQVFVGMGVPHDVTLICPEATHFASPGCHHAIVSHDGKLWAMGPLG